jgi:hypothetical protein
LLRLIDDLPHREVLRIRPELMIRACDAIQREIATSGADVTPCRR